ncbi:HNH endonuclease [Azospirillum ramasamyi]|uniref:HNH endonuclease signature motif containing protein n=1 Tax=Azospirillum ramasamyi TaxID=682998 RepID=UPI0013A689FD|nr:HNH endonuclease [Azospirillum ramasamyi]
MWTLIQPEINDVAAQLDRALSRDRGVAPYQLTDAERIKVLDRYKEFDSSGGLGSQKLQETTLNEALLSALYDSYSQVQLGARLETLRNKLISAARLCPYCGAPSVTDLDHYLPRSIYKDFAIYPRNLVPSCHPCNNVKRAFTPGSLSENLIQPYYDSLPDCPFLVAETIIPESGGIVVTFSIDMSINADPILLKRAQSQVSKFELNTRLIASINVFLSTIRPSVEMAFEFGKAQSVVQFLERAIRTHTKDFGMNDWRVALLRSLAQNHDFCDGDFQKALGNINLSEGVS